MMKEDDERAGSGRAWPSVPVAAAVGVALGAIFDNLVIGMAVSLGIWAAIKVVRQRRGGGEDGRDGR
jgi:hypothetical protein